jgi:uncharacterized protein
MPAVQDDHLSAQFTIYSDGVVAGSLRYRLEGNEIWFLRTTIDRGFRNRDLETVLVLNALDSAHRRHLAVRPFDRTVRKTMVEHPEYHHLLPRRQGSPVRRLAATI